MKEGVIGIIYRHDFNDYEFMIANLDEKSREKIEKVITEFDDGYNIAGCRGNSTMTLNDANIAHFESNEWNQRFVSTQDPEDIVTLPQIFNRYYQINGTHEGFEEYVNAGFCNGNEIEYKKL